jgi:transposase
VVQAPAPQRVIDRGLPGPGLLAHVITAKFADHTPLYRQSQIFACEGVELEHSVLARWVGEAAALLAPVAEVLRRYVLDTEKLHAGDGTAPAVWFTYSPDRKGEHPQRHLAKFEGILQADAFAGFNKLYEGGAIREAPCMAHIRRKFFDLMKLHQSPIATEAVERIAALYRIEKEIKGRSADERRAVRAARARPLFDDIPVFVAIDFLVLERLHERLALNVVVGIAAAAHTDLDAVGFEQIGVAPRGVLQAAIGVMHQAGSRLTCSERHLQGFDAKRRLQRAVQRQPTTLRENASKTTARYTNSVSSRT